MPYVSSPHDGAQLFYQDYRPSSKVPAYQATSTRATNVRKNIALFFLHGWPMSGKMYEHLVLPMCESDGIRCVVTDRRGFGKSEWTGPQATGDITYETLAGDTFAIIDKIADLDSFVFVCASMACGESVLVYELLRGAGKESKCKGFVWLGPSLPFPLRTESNPLAPPRELWDMILNGFRTDRQGFTNASIGGVFGTNHGIGMTETALEFYVDLVKQADIIAIERCLQLYTHYDFSEKLRWLGSIKSADVPVLVIHGEMDNDWPPEAGPKMIQDLVPGSVVQVWEMAAHGLYYTHAGQVRHAILGVLETL